VLIPVKFDEQLHGNTRIFKSRMVREVKGKNTENSVAVRSVSQVRDPDLN